MFGFWDWVGGRYSMDSAIGLSLMIAIGPDDFRELLAGFRAMDEHFRAAPLGAEPAGAAGAARESGTATSSAFETHAVLPYSQELQPLPGLPAAAGHGVERQVGPPRRHAGDATDTGPIVWGTAGTNGQHAYYQLLHQGTQLVPARPHRLRQPAPTDARRPPRPADGQPVRPGRGAGLRQDPRRGRRRRRARRTRSTPACSRATGRRPSILADRLTPRCSAPLIALYEHKVFVQGVIWGIDSFDQWGVELGKVLATRIAAELTA